MFQALATTLRFSRTTLGQLDALAVLLHEGAQLVLERLENRQVFVEVGDKAIDGGIEPIEQFAFLWSIPMVAFAGFRDHVEQASRRVGLVQEHAPVLDRHLDVRHQHAADLAAHVHVELRTVKQDVE